MGTPHEAACDAGLLALAQRCATPGEPDGKPMRLVPSTTCARSIASAWTPQKRACQMTQGGLVRAQQSGGRRRGAVPALRAYRGCGWVERYGLPTLQRMMAYRVQDRVGLMAPSRRTACHRRIEKYFPLYIARCIRSFARLSLDP